MLRWYHRATFAVCGLLLLSAASVAACDLPTTFFDHQPALPRIVSDLRNGRPVLIVTMGGASTQGNAAGEDANLAWPERLAVALRGRFPGASVRVANLGAPRQTALDMRLRLERELPQLKPSLVIWETGITDAVRGISPVPFREAVQAGIERLKASNIDVVLMDMQYSHRALAVYDLTEYLDAMEEVAIANGIPLFRRHEAMREWSTSGVFDFDVTDPANRRDVAARLYDCIGRGVADLIARRQETAAPVNAARGLQR